MRIGIDAGGTFTDFVVLHDDGRLDTFKLRSNPRAPQDVILAGIAQAGAGAARIEIVHGSTVATNALLERKGAPTAFVTNPGFEDLLEIGRQNRSRLYDLTPGPKRLLIPPERCFGAQSAADLGSLRRKLRRSGVRSVAVCFLHSYRDPALEQAVRAALAPDFDVSVSHEICPEFREFERASTTALNGYVGPLMRDYLERLAGSCPHPISVMQSNGGAMSVAEASRLAVRTILSGPAGGVTGAMEAARASGISRVLGFDMGGTSTDVHVSDGNPRETMEATVDGLPVRVPMLEIHTVGAGGGSIARVDSGGLLRVGPESAGADPGPACYGRGALPTVTDAHVVLGRIDADQLAGGSLPIDVARARAAVQQIADAARLTLEQAACGVVRVANATMSRAIRVVSVERGHDPRDFALVAFGGCGGLHACDLAEDLGIRTIVAPALAGSLSALGMLLADRVRDYSAGVLGVADVPAQFSHLEAAARTESPGSRIERFADLRYRGQSYEITVPWRGAATAKAFHAAHARTYGYSDSKREVEVVAIRVRARKRTKRPPLTAPLSQPAPAQTARRVFVDGKWRQAPVVSRTSVPTRGLAGPAILIDYGSTTLINAGWRIEPSGAGNILATR